jgi:DNA polymerase III subunit gamma/tau
MAWYNKYRPQTFEEVIGQGLIKKVFINALKTGKIKNGYLLSGPKGVGKTTTARIFANELNQTSKNPEAKIDIIELDAASNTGIDNIRQLIESAQNPPISGKYKVYIIDEVHMLSKAAMNALLKILEEPPSYLVFILATTNPEKILPTVLSRLTSLNLSSHTLQDLVERLEFIANQEAVQIDLESLKLIAKRAGGSQRDSINLLETLSSFNLEKYTKKETSQLLGLVSEEVFINLASRLLEDNFDYDFLSELENQTLEAESFLAQFLEFLIDQSFNSSSNYDGLILPVSEVLSLKLPTSSIISLLAILKTKINPPQKYIPAEPSLQLKSQSNSNLKSESKISENNIENNQIKANLEIKNSVENLPLKPEKKTQKIEEFNSNQNLTPAELQLYLRENLKSNAIFRMIAQDLGVEEILDQKVILSVSSGIFLGQLKAGSLHKQITQTAKEVLNRNLIIEVIQRNSKSPKIKTVAPFLASDIKYDSIEDEMSNLEISEPKTNFDSEFNSSFENVESSKEFQDLDDSFLEMDHNNDKNHNKDKKKAIISSQKEKIKESSSSNFKPISASDAKITSEEKIFYKVYKQLPENMENSGVEVLDQKDFKKPSKKISSEEISGINLKNENQSEKDWDKELEEMFEFE